mgnify:CR=1 FL=1
MNEELRGSGSVPPAKQIGFFEKYLPLWVGLCMVVGVVLGQLVPSVTGTSEVLSGRGHPERCRLGRGGQGCRKKAGYARVRQRSQGFGVPSGEPFGGSEG